MNEIGFETLEKDLGIDKFIEAMDTAFKPEDKIRAFTMNEKFFLKKWRGNKAWKSETL